MLHLRRLLTVGIGFAATILLSSGANAQQAPFVRGDVNDDGQLDVSDPVATIHSLFLGGPAPSCEDAADANDDSRIDLSDAIATLAFLFQGGPRLPEPLGECGLDPTEDDLSCVTYSNCSGGDCVDPAMIQKVVDIAVPASVCIPADATQTELEGLTITVCPVEEAGADCNEAGDTGCAIRFGDVDASFDGEGRRFVLSVDGSLPDLPLLLENELASLVCSLSIEFAGDVVVPFRAQEHADGSLEILELLEPQVENPMVDVSIDGGLLCNLLATQEDAIAEEVVNQLEQTAGALVDPIAGFLVGEVICTIPR